MKVREALALFLPLLLSACGSLPTADPPVPTRPDFETPSPAEAARATPPPPVRVRPTAPQSSSPPPSLDAVRAESYLVVDTLTGRILAEKNARTRRAVASTQKLLTALCVLRDGPLADPVTVQNSDTQVEPSKIYIKPGETYTRRELVKALLVKSGNDVAKALARDVAGSEDAFIARMNRTAASLGMSNSNFKNPHGLTEEGQYSTAFDLAILAREVTKIPFFRSCMQTKEYLFQFPDGRSKKLTNTNKVLKRLPYCTGMKTGYTRASGRCLVSSGVHNGRAVIAVALGSTSADIWDDSETLLRNFLE